MTTQRLILGAVFAFVLGWGALLVGAINAPPPESPLPSVAAESPLPSVAAESPPKSKLSREEVARHNRPEDCWLLIRGKAYDVTRYIASHPAPPEVITDYCGKESTQAFETKARGRSHSPYAWQQLDAYVVGEVRD
jgi:Cytochrome b5-like Heme/Steroid binding domain